MFLQLTNTHCYFFIISYSDLQRNEKQILVQQMYTKKNKSIIPLLLWLQSKSTIMDKHSLTKLIDKVLLINLL